MTQPAHTSHLRASHLEVQIQDELAAARLQSILQREAAREAERYRPPAPVAKPPSAAKPARRVIPTRRVAPTTKRREGAAPDGSLTLSAAEVVALDHLLATHPETRPQTRRKA